MPIWYSGGSTSGRKRSLLGTEAVAPQRPPGQKSRALSSMAAKKRRDHPLPGPGRKLLAWEWGGSYEHEFTAVTPFVSSSCPDPDNTYNEQADLDENYVGLISGDGVPQGTFRVYDSGVCAQRNTQWVSCTPLLGITCMHASFVPDLSAATCLLFCVCSSLA
jgi:hypothetical protein